MRAKGLRPNDDGDLIHTRSLPTGEAFDVIKNMPTEAQLREDLDGLADDLKYFEFDDSQLWAVSYRTSDSSKSSV